LPHTDTALFAGAQKLLTAENFKAKVVVDGEVAEGEVAAITIANAAPPFSVLAHGHTGECVYGEQQHIVSAAFVCTCPRPCCCVFGVQANGVNGNCVN
jgi:hypothetical protein